MDEMKIGTQFMKGILSKAIGAMLKKKCGYDIDIRIEDISIVFDGGKAHAHLNVNADLKKDEITKILAQAGIG